MRGQAYLFLQVLAQAWGPYGLRHSGTVALPAASGSPEKPRPPRSLEPALTMLHGCQCTYSHTPLP